MPITVKGKYTDAVIFPASPTDQQVETVEKGALGQIEWICSQEVHQGSKVRVMPDVHPGKVGPVGLTMTVNNAVLPSLVGVDIACGVAAARLDGRKVDFEKFDRWVAKEIPSGFAVREKPLAQAQAFPFEDLICARHIQSDASALSLGTLGSGNHFLELDVDEDGVLWATVHTGSRRLGFELANWYMKLAQEACKAAGHDVAFESAWLEGENLADYLHDMAIVAEFARLNRRVILEKAAKGLGMKIVEMIESVHNIVDSSVTPWILRKGAVSAREGEPVIVPINMRDGILHGIGKGNSDWNMSAPHGAGRILRRDAVKNVLTVSAFRKSMAADGVHCPTINAETLEEAPVAYRPLEAILSVVEHTMTVTRHLKPIWCFKGSNVSLEEKHKNKNKGKRTR